MQNNGFSAYFIHNAFETWNIECRCDRYSELSALADEFLRVKMELLGALILITVVCLNAAAFFRAGEHRKHIYDRTASDTEFNKLHQ